MYFVYIIECADKSLYTGITTDVKRRFEEHKQGTASRYTRAKGVRRILYTERRRTKSSALKREWEIKKLARKEKFELIRRA